MYIGIDYSRYKTGYYQNDLLETLQKSFNVMCYGIGFSGYNESLSIKDVINKFNFNPDLIIISDTWEIQDLNITRFDPNPNLKLNELNIPKLFFLNKEYKKIDLKLDFIKNNEIDYVTSVLKHECRKWEETTGSTFIWKPFGLNFGRIQKSNKKRKYDFGFTGAVHERWIQSRVLIKNHIFEKKYLNFKRIHNLYHKKRFKEKYSGLNIYWGEWFQKKILPGHSRVPTFENYFKLLTKIKIFLNTKSAVGIIGTRFLELMASKSMILCPEDDYYGLYQNKVNCIMYRDLNDFDEKLFYYVKNNEEREKIVEKAYQDSFNYCWEKIVFDLLNKIKFI
ncbi:MAG: glycosyltransferase family 1 protein [Candidatus Lokiarchaeota archaeon]|nr:glycosyltransferase family 1 protein [Candidatus Lokiarchaeota archaeon]